MMTRSVNEVVKKEGKETCWKQRTFSRKVRKLSCTFPQPPYTKIATFRVVCDSLVVLSAFLVL